MAIGVTLESIGVGKLQVGFRNIAIYMPVIRGRTIKRIARYMMYYMKDVVKSEAKVSTGRLASGFKMRQVGRGEYTITNIVPYAAYVNEGTKPHFIPFGLGKIEGVEHPGSKAMRFVEKGIKRSTKFIGTIPDKEIKNTIRRNLR